MLEDSFRRGDELFDLGAGYLDIKRHWLTALETPYTYTHFAPGVPRARCCVPAVGRGAIGKALPAERCGRCRYASMSDAAKWALPSLDSQRHSSTMTSRVRPRRR